MTRSPESLPIIVLGAERSGTSVIAEMVQKWGAYAGDPKELHEADVHAPRGYWEFLPLWDLLSDLGDFSSGATWWDPTFQQRMKDKGSDPTYRTKALKLISRMNKNNQPWFWKDPALSHFLPFWNQIWGNAVYIITVRNPRDTAISWQKFVMPSNLEGRVSFIAINLIRWQHMMMQILQHTENATHRLFVAYEDIVREPRAQAERLCEFLDSRFNTSSHVQDMVQAVDPQLWRNDCKIPFNQVEEATAEQKALYSFIRRKIDNSLELFDSTMYPMPPGFLEFLNMQDALLRAYNSSEESTNT